MTLHPALARLARGATRLYWDLPKRLILGARAYRFEGEQAAHAEQLRETEISLALMQSASDDPDHVRMASEIEHGAENRLSVLLGKARLTMEEKGERDAIQRAISVRRQSFAAPAAAQPRRFLPALPAASGAIGLLMSPWTWLVALGAFCVLQMGLKERVENQRDEAREALTEAARTIDLYEQRELEYAAHMEAAREARDAAIETADRERRIRERERQQQRRAERDLEAARRDRGEPIDWGLPVAGTEPESTDGPGGD